LILHLKVSPILCLLWTTIISYFSPLFCYSGQESIHIFYTTNLNCTLTDCQCGGDTVGGFIRVVTKLKQLRESYLDMVLLDAGDFLNSYPLTKENEKMIYLMSFAKFNYLNPGEQEFVDGAEFLFTELENMSGKLKLISGNLTSNQKGEFLFETMGYIKRGNFEISVTGLINPTAFDFMQKDQIRVLSPNTALENLESRMNQSDFQILLFHGYWKDAELLAESFPWIDLIIISHSQEMKFKLLNKTAMVEAGTEGRYLGHLEASFVNSHWRFTNNFIPITKSVDLSEEALKIIN